MKTKIINSWVSMRTSFCFDGFTYFISPEGARSILATIAGSMMTVAYAFIIGPPADPGAGSRIPD